MSEAQAAYFERLRLAAHATLEVAQAARAKGFDPRPEVEVVLAEDLAARVEAQVGIDGVAVRVRELLAEQGNREVVALQAAREMAAGRFQQFSSREAAIDKAVRLGLSILTEGVLVAPLEGIASVQLGINHDGSEYVDLFFAGPIRAAGGTAQAMSVLIADVVRRDLGLGAYRATTAEVQRLQEEIPAYKRAANLQYTPTGDEIESIVRNIPVCINGEGTEKVEVTGHRDLPRVQGNRLRGGVCLVIAEGLCLKAPKLVKHVRALDLPGWEFLERFVNRKAPQDAAEEHAAPAAPADDGEEPAEPLVEELKASYKYIRDLIGGRPVFGHPSRPGGFRLRYGRAPTAGLAATAISPVTMHALQDFLAVGTQIKTERPGKATVATPCDALEGPAVVLENGDFVRVDTLSQWRGLASKVSQIADLGEILVPYGEFVENNQPLADSSYVQEWWIQDVAAAAGDEVASQWAQTAPDYATSLELSRRYGCPLHPAFTLMWHDLELQDFESLRRHVADHGTFEDGGLRVESDPQSRTTLVALGAYFVRRGRDLHFMQHSEALIDGLGLLPEPGRLRLRELPPVKHLDRYPVLRLVCDLMAITVMPRAPTRIGARMGRPEKADARKMSPPVHGLFPVGNVAGTQRKLSDALTAREYTSVLGKRRCRECGRDGHGLRCGCDGGTDALPDPPMERRVRIREDLEHALRRLDFRHPPDVVKGVNGLVSARKWPEPIEKGMLRSRHGVWVFKDGTTRFDMTDAPLTHFRPMDVGTPVERLRELGYVEDIDGRALSEDDQWLELRVQDVVVSRAGADYLLATARFVDELLVRFYGMPKFYGASKVSDLAGQLVVGLAPHTSAGVLARIIGFTSAQVCWGHPFFHAAKRRNCDGDEDALLLLLDCLINFSRDFVPDRRGGLMDLPLVLTTRLDPNEIDKEAHNLDVSSRYPRELYEAAARHAHPREVRSLIPLLEDRLGTPGQYEGMAVTHRGGAFDAGPASSSYKTLGAMWEKMDAQLDLADRLRAVDAADVADRVISTHLLPDLLGNLKAFTRQKVRCTKCGSKYRRVPLAGHCTHAGRNGQRCGNALTLTVHEKSVKKYLEIVEQLIVRYDVPVYTRQRVQLARKYMDDAFAPNKYRTKKLVDFV